jgi:hypothetical protein
MMMMNSPYNTVKVVSSTIGIYNSILDWERKTIFGAEIFQHGVLFPITSGYIYLNY